jgi:hypothetical protein
MYIETLWSRTADFRYDDPGKVFLYPFVQQLPEWGTSLSDFFENNDVDRDACFDIAPDLGAWYHHLSHSNVSWVDGRDPNVRLPPSGL